VAEFPKGVNPLLGPYAAIYPASEKPELPAAPTGRAPRACIIRQYRLSQTVMNRPREKQDGLPYRVYERCGVRIYSVGYKQTDGKWAFRYSCPIKDKDQINDLRHKAVTESALLNHGVRSCGATEELIDAWFRWQESLPSTDLKRRADSTLRENRNEAKNLKTEQ
jgi:hypothetical protein